VTENLRLAVACMVALLALVVLAVGVPVVHAGRKLWAVADRVSPPSDW
jgi:hypothetical protein